MSALEGGGEAGELVRRIDWARSPIGPVETWSQSLKVTVGIVLHSRHPMFLWWGPELIQFYNDAYTPSFGQGRHPEALGQRGRDCWGEIWPIIWPQIEDVMARGKPSWNEDALVPILRNGRLEEVYWTYGYSPVFDDDGSVGGTLVLCTETTKRVLSARRLRVLGDLTESITLAEDSARVDQIALQALGRATLDVPFAFICSASGPTDAIHVTETAGLSEARARELAQGIGASHLSNFQTEEHAPLAVPGATIVSAAWPEPVVRLFLETLRDSSGQPRAQLVVGLSPRLEFDEGYREFLRQVAERIGFGLGRLEIFRARTLAENERNHLLEKTHREREVLLAQLEAANRSKDEFLAMLGHELRNPLSPITTALELIKLRSGGQSGHEEQIIERQVTHLTRLVDDLLDVSKITRGKVELKRERIEMSDVLARAVEMASFLFEQRGHRLSIDAPRSGLQLKGDPVRLAQVVANLLTNAARYTNFGGSITLRARRVSEDEPGGQASPQIVITVADDGVGISAEMLPQIFELFVQGKRTRERAEGGLGLGLALVKNLVELHGGQVHAESEGLGKGSVFTIHLPALPSGGAPDSAPAKRAPIVAGPARNVLVVDDNADAADLLNIMLLTAGHQVTVAHDPLEALEIASAPEFELDVVVLDIGLPVMDGYELGARLRARSAGCRLIALTGYGQPEDQERSRKAGFDVHLVKPVEIAKLLAAIRG